MEKTEICNELREIKVLLTQILDKTEEIDILADLTETILDEVITSAMVQETH